MRKRLLSERVEKHFSLVSTRNLCVAEGEIESGSMLFFDTCLEKIEEHCPFDDLSFLHRCRGNSLTWLRICPIRWHQNEDKSSKRTLREEEFVDDMVRPLVRRCQWKER